MKIVETRQTSGWHRANAVEITLSLLIKHHDNIVVFVNCSSIFRLTTYLHRAVSKERSALSHFSYRTVMVPRLLDDLVNS